MLVPVINKTFLVFFNVWNLKEFLCLLSWIIYLKFDINLTIQNTTHGNLSSLRRVSRCEHEHNLWAASASMLAVTDHIKLLYANKTTIPNSNNPNAVGIQIPQLFFYEKLQANLRKSAGQKLLLFIYLCHNYLFFYYNNHWTLPIITTLKSWIQYLSLFVPIPQWRMYQTHEWIQQVYISYRAPPPQHRHPFKYR